MPWFDLTGDARLGRCATEGCGGQPTFRLEADGVGSNFCSGCRELIDRPICRVIADCLSEEDCDTMRTSIYQIPIFPRRCFVAKECVYRYQGICDEPRINRGNSDAACWPMSNKHLLKLLDDPDGIAGS